MSGRPEHAARAALRALVQAPEARHLTVGAMARRVGVDRTTARRWIDHDFPGLAQEYWPRTCDLLAAAAVDFKAAEVRAAQGGLLSLPPPPESGGEEPGLLE